MLTRAIALSPHDPAATWFFGSRALGHLLLREFGEAVADARTAIKLRYGYLFGRAILVTALAESDRLEDARKELNSLLSVSRDFTPAILDRAPFRSEADRERLVAGLRAAERGDLQPGVVDEPSDPITDRRLPSEVGKLVLHNPRIVILPHRAPASTVRAP
jgi:hypothetical protein